MYVLFVLLLLVLLHNTTTILATTVPLLGRKETTAGENLFRTRTSILYTPLTRLFRSLLTAPRLLGYAAHQGKITMPCLLRPLMLSEKITPLKDASIPTCATTMLFYIYHCMFDFFNSACMMFLTLDSSLILPWLVHKNRVAFVGTTMAATANCKRIHDTATNRNRF